MTSLSKRIENGESAADIARSQFLKAYNGERNAFTPNIIEYGITGGYSYELSYGTGFMVDAKIYGVTLINTILGTKEYDKSQAFSSEQEARDYIKSLQDVNNAYYDGGAK